MRHHYRVFVAILLTAAFVLSFTSQAFCDDPIKKLGRGVANIVTSPFEIFNQIQKSNESDGAVAGWTVGPIKGVWMTGVRAVVGVYETCTFFVPIPKRYEPILTDPEFFSEDLIA